jgi:hypothetical protein
MSNTSIELSLQEMIGRECIYYEKALFHIEVLNVKVVGDLLLLGLSQISTVGFSLRDLGLFEVSCVYMDSTILPNLIHASPVNWTLVINENATQHLVRAAAAAVDPLDLFQEYKRLRRKGFEIGG